MTQYDVVIIGSGPGGYVAAIRSAQLGMKTAIIEKYSTLGGTCLNVGCIPSKALLDSSEHFHNAIHNFAEHGIKMRSKPTVDFKQMIDRKNSVVSQTCDGVAYLMNKNKIDVYHGFGAFVDKNTIKITKEDKSEEQIVAKYTIIATGSKPADLPFLKVDKNRIISSTEALSLTTLPKTMTVIGGGVIGCELGAVYARLGTKVTIIEYADKLSPSIDQDASKELLKIMKSLDVDVHLNTGVQAAEVKGKKVHLKAENHKKKEALEFESDYCLLSVGRRPYTDNLGLENTGVETDDRGFVKVDAHLKTSADNIYAIGDVIGGAMLAHKAEEEGVFVVESIAGQKPHVNYLLIPSVIYVWPEIAGVGHTEQDLKKNKVPYKKGSFPFKALGRARASMDTGGFVKVLAHKETDEILGVHIVGARAADLIMEGVVAMEYRASAEDVSRMSHPHPTFSEAFKEACLAATENRAIHM